MPPPPTPRPAPWRRRTWANRCEQAVHHGGSRFTLRLYPIVRTGTQVVATQQLSYDELSWQDRQERSWPLSDTGAMSGQSYNRLPNGITLLDLPGAMACPVAIAELDRSVCTAVPDELGTGTVATWSCLYVIPEDVSRVTVQSSYFGLLGSVPVVPRGSEHQLFPTPQPTGQLQAQAEPLEGVSEEVTSQVHDPVEEVRSGQQEMDVRSCSPTRWAEPSTGRPCATTSS